MSVPNVMAIHDSFRATFHANLSNSCQDISLKAKTVNPIVASVIRNHDLRTTNVFYQISRRYVQYL